MRALSGLEDGTSLTEQLSWAASMPLCLAAQVIRCIENGLPLLIENLPEDVDAVMDSVIGKQTIRRGRALLLRIGDAEVEYNPGFRRAPLPVGLHQQRFHCYLPSPDALLPLRECGEVVGACRPVCYGSAQAASRAVRVRRLYLATKLANPHYRPEIAAQTTLVNFCVTEDGLEEQLLAAVVDHERPDLQARLPKPKTLKPKRP